LAWAEQVTDAADGTLTLKDVKVLTPAEPARELVAGLDLEIAAGERLLVVGRSGVCAG